MLTRQQIENWQTSHLDQAALQRLERLPTDEAKRAAVHRLAQSFDRLQ